MSKSRALLFVALTLAVTTPSIQSQTRPRLADYFTEIPVTVIDADYAPKSIRSPMTADLNGDGNQDLIVIGVDYAGGGRNCCSPGTPQPGRVYLGDGAGHFTPAPTALFPIDTLKTVFTEGLLFADFNGDARTDMFIPGHGWDADPFPGEQNRLYLSVPGGGWTDATDTLPQLSDMSVASAAGDISGRGALDIFVANGGAGQAHIGAYTLLNTGSGQFTQTFSNIPVVSTAAVRTPCGNPGQPRCRLLDSSIQGATLADLNDDGLPELIVTGRTLNGDIHTETILWNRDGVFTDTDTTALPDPAIFPTRFDWNVKRIDVNLDGLQDLVLVGTQQNYAGWFVQILVNRGDRQFVDETAERVPAGQGSGGGDGPPASVYPANVQVLDFNQDGAPDFAVEFITGSTPLTQSQPLIWINDGTGHFSTLTVGDFVTAGRENVLATAHLVATRNGYSFITPRWTGSGGLKLTGVLATKPYRVTTRTSATHHDGFR